MAEGVEAIVLRTLRYGEADVIAHVLTREAGRRGVIAKGARKPKSRLGARLDPFLVVSLQLHVGKGDLAIVRGVEIIAAHDLLRQNWQAQQLGAVALDMVNRMSVEHEPNEAMYHLLRNFLDLLDGTAGSDTQRLTALLAAFQLKLLHVGGIAPQLGACVRCGDATGLVAFSAADGGVICAGCRTASDQTIDAASHAAAVQLMRDPLASIIDAETELPTLHALRTVTNAIVAGMSQEHAGVRPRTSR